jgi:hypothetical protein
MRVPVFLFVQTNFVLIRQVLQVRLYVQYKSHEVLKGQLHPRSLGDLSAVHLVV